MNFFRVFLGTTIARNFGVKSPTDFADGMISAVPRSAAVGAVLVSAIAPNQARAARGGSIGAGANQVAAPTLSSATVNPAVPNIMQLSGTNFGVDINALVVTFGWPGTDIQVSGAQLVLVSQTSLQATIPIGIPRANAVEVTVTVSGVDSNTLTIAPAGTATNIAIANNSSPQSAMIATAFQGLVVSVTDGWGNPVPGAAVTFTAVAPQAGPSGTFGAAAGAPINQNQNTNALGVATANGFTANANPGGPYAVSATVAGVPVPAYFSLTNLPNAG